MRTLPRQLLPFSVLLFTSVANAQGTDPAAAEALYRQGNELMAAGKLADACPKLEESLRLDPTGSTAAQLGKCFEAQGKTASAWVKYQTARDFARKKGATGPERELTEKIDALEKKLSKLVVVVPKEVGDISGVLVKRDGIELGRGSWGTPLPVDPGPHVVEAQAPGKKPSTVKIDVAAGAVATAQVPMLQDEPKPAAAAVPVAKVEPDTSAKPAATSAPPSDTPPPTGMSTQKVLGFVGIGLGAVGVVTGVLFYSSYRSKDADVKSYGDANAKTCVQPCTAEYAQLSSLKSDRDAKIAPMGVAFGVGGALALTGVLLVATAPSGSKAAVRFAPTVGTGGGGLVAVGSF